jgi:hypothetical protein
MSANAFDVLERLLDELQLRDKAQRVADGMYRFRWGSANVIAGAAGEAICVVAPLFPALPERNPDGFCRRLLELNGRMGGTAGFALAADGSVVLQTGRGVAGLDASEFALMLGTVGKFADDHDDALHAEWYGDAK